MDAPVPASDSPPPTHEPAPAPAPFDPHPPQAADDDERPGRRRRLAPPASPPDQPPPSRSISPPQQPPPSSPSRSISPPHQPPPSPSRCRRTIRISCHADLQAPQDDRPSDGRMFLKMVSLESVSIATDSYALLLRNLIERRYWRCPQIQIHLLSLVAGVAVEFDKMKHHLFPLAEAKLGDDGFPKALLLLKNSALALIHLAEDAQEIVVKEPLVEEDKVQAMGALLDKVHVVGAVLEFNADEVMNGTRKFAWFHSRLPPVLNEIDLVLSTPVYFPDSE